MFEPAARKMDVDEDYDDVGDMEKRVSGTGGGNNSGNGSIAQEPEGRDAPLISPARVNGGTKVESTA